MNEIITALSNSGISSGQIALAIVVIRIAGQTYKACVNGHGLIGVWHAFLYGANVEKQNPAITPDQTKGN
jgi:hypothetical protein